MKKILGIGLIMCSIAAGISAPAFNMLEESAKAEMKLSAQSARISGRQCRYCGNDFSCVTSRYIAREDQKDADGYTPVGGLVINSCGCVDKETGDPIQSFDLFGTSRSETTLRRIAEDAMRHEGAECLLVSETTRYIPDVSKSTTAVNLDTDSAGNVVYRALR